jgi:hypothetical protein
MMFGLPTAVGGALALGFFHVTRQPDAPRRGKILLRSGAIYIGGVALAAAPTLVLLLGRRRARYAT